MKSLLKILNQDTFSLSLLLISDLIGLLGAFWGAYYVRNDLLGPAIQPFEVYWKAFPAVAILTVITFYAFGLYERHRRITPISELYHLIRAITLVWILVMAASFLYKYDYSRILVILFYGLGLVTLNLGRMLIRKITQKLHLKGKGVIRVLIIGSGKTARRVAEQLKQYDAFGYRIVGFVDEKNPSEQEKNSKHEWTIVGRVDELLALIQTHDIQEVYVADPGLSHERILNLMHRCEQADVKFKVLSSLFEIVAGEIDLKDIEGLPSLDLRKGQKSVFYSALKRLMDILLSVIGLISSAPLFLILSLAIRRESPGPAIFAQKRVGKSGKKFIMYKFRTMHSNVKASDYSPQSQDDPRITKIGRWLRKTSLDELPQLWNVLKGEMSMVGPRPEMPFIVAHYTDWQKRRLDVKPGITGLWQILGRKDLPLHENIEYDFYYIKNQSLVLDIVILLKTIAVVVKGKGAY